MDFPTLIQNFNNGLYTTHTQYPKKPKPLDPATVLDENQTVVWNRNEVTRRNDEAKEAYVAALNAYEQEAKNKLTAAYEDTIAAIMNNGFNRKQAEVVYGEAYERGHSFGHAEIANVASNICDFAKRLLSCEG